MGAFGLASILAPVAYAALVRAFPARGFDLAFLLAALAYLRAAVVPFFPAPPPDDDEDERAPPPPPRTTTATATAHDDEIRTGATGGRRKGSRRHRLRSTPRAETPRPRPRRRRRGGGLGHASDGYEPSHRSLETASAK